MKMRDLINIFEADVINFADKLNDLSNKLASSVPQIHKQNIDMKKRAATKLNDIKNKGHNMLAAKLGAESDYVKDFLHGYMEAALWSSTNMDNDEPFDRRYGLDNISPETKEEMLHTCKAFIKAVDAAGFALANIPADQAGHDFWLTQNHHGSGFWDRDLSPDEEATIVNIAHRFGESNLYVGEDGDIRQEHHMPRGFSYT